MELLLLYLLFTSAWSIFALSMFIHACIQPSWAYTASGTTKTTAILLYLFVPCVGPLLYTFSTRPRLKEVQRGTQAGNIPQQQVGGQQQFIASRPQYGIAPQPGYGTQPPASSAPSYSQTVSMSAAPQTRAGAGSPPAYFNGLSIFAIVTGVAALIVPIVPRWSYGGSGFETSIIKSDELTLIFPYVAVSLLCVLGAFLGGRMGGGAFAGGAAAIAGAQYMQFAFTGGDSVSAEFRIACGAALVASISLALTSLSSVLSGRRTSSATGFCIAGGIATLAVLAAREPWNWSWEFGGGLWTYAGSQTMLVVMSLFVGVAGMASGRRNGIMLMLGAQCLLTTQWITQVSDVDVALFVASVVCVLVLVSGLITVVVVDGSATIAPSSYAFVPQPMVQGRGPMLGSPLSPTTPQPQPFVPPAVLHSSSPHTKAHMGSESWWDKPAPVAAPQVETPQLPVEFDDSEITGTIPRAGTSGPLVRTAGVEIRFDSGVVERVLHSGIVGRNPVRPGGDALSQLIAIDDPSQSVSKTHFALGIETDGMWVEDRHSINGTVVIRPDGTRLPLEGGVRSPLRRGDILQFGDRKATIA